MSVNKGIWRRKWNLFWRPPEYEAPIENRLIDPFYRSVSPELVERARRRRRRWRHDWVTGWWWHPDNMLGGVRAWAALAALLFIPVAIFSYASGVVGLGICIEGFGCVASEDTGLRWGLDDSVTVGTGP